MKNIQRFENLTSLFEDSEVTGRTENFKFSNFQILKSILINPKLLNSHTQHLITINSIIHYGFRFRNDQKGVC